MVITLSLTDTSMVLGKQMDIYEVIGADYSQNAQRHWVSFAGSCAILQLTITACAMLLRRWVRDPGDRARSSGPRCVKSLSLYVGDRGGCRCCIWLIAQYVKSRPHVLRLLDKPLTNVE
jgi:hypothetical protein